jgi:hypothetical protein
MFLCFPHIFIISSHDFPMNLASSLPMALSVVIRMRLAEDSQVSGSHSRSKEPRGGSFHGKSFQSG